MFEIMIDTGGTFTDGVLVDDKQSISVAKAETQPQDPARSILNCIARLAEERNMTQQELLRNTSTVTIGTTLQPLAAALRHMDGYMREHSRLIL